MRVAELFDPDVGRDTGFSTLSRIAADLGFPYIICAPVRSHPDAKKNWMITSYPESWQQLYVEKGYLERNPIRRHTLITSRPFTWSGLESQLPEDERELFQDCRACGMSDAVVVPVHGPWGQATAVGFACDSNSALNADAARMLHILAFCFVTTYSDESYVPKVYLTEREQEILSLVAKGYSGYQVADLLKLSVNSVEWHMKNIFAKFGVRSRTAAVIKAVQMGYVKI